MEQSLGEWLNHQLSEQLDLRPPRKNGGVEEKKLQAIAKVTLLERGNPIGHLELHRRGRAIEFSCVVVDSAHRGKGLSHQLLAQAIARAGQDPIVSGRPLGDLQEKGVLLICWTRNAALASALITAGFKMRPMRRHWTTLGLRKGNLNYLPFSTRFAMFTDRGGNAIEMLFKDRKRLWHQFSHLSDYHLFTMMTTDARQHTPPEVDDFSGRIEALGMDMVHVSEKPEVSTQDIQTWDEGE